MRKLTPECERAGEAGPKKSSNFLTAKRRTAIAERAAARRDPRQLDLFDNERMSNDEET